MAAVNGSRRRLQPGARAQSTGARASVQAADYRTFVSRLSYVEITGLAGRSEPFRHEFDPRLDVFFGLNGSGKTSLLKMLYSALRNEADLLHRIAFKTAEVRFYSHDRDYEITRRIDKSQLVSSTQRRRAGTVVHYGEYQVPRSIEPHPWSSDPDTDVGPFRVSYLPISRMYWDPRGIDQLREYDRPSFSESALDERFAQQLTQSWYRYSNQLLADVRGIQQNGLVGILRSLLTGNQQEGGSSPLDARLAFQKASAFLQRQGSKLPGSEKSFAQKYQQDARLRSVVDDIDEIERRIESAEMPRRNLQRLVDDFNATSKDIVFGDREIEVKIAGGESIQLSALSSGEKQLLKILVETLDAEESVMLIDEPELSMHIDWQRQLVGAMQTLNPAAQLILATHSPEIMALVPDQRIRQL